MAQGKKPRRAKAKPESEPHMVDLSSGILYVHEALHMTEYLSRAVDTELGEHAAVESRPQWLALCRVASGALGELYQKIGQESYYLQNPEKRPAAEPYQGFRTAAEKTYEIWEALHNELVEEAEIKRRPEWAALVVQAEDALGTLLRLIETGGREATKRGGGV
jgi:hypothetical protein